MKATRTKAAGQRTSEDSRSPPCVWEEVEVLCLDVLRAALPDSEGQQASSHQAFRWHSTTRACSLASDMLRAIERAHEYASEHPFSVLSTLLPPTIRTAAHLREITANKSGRGRRPVPRTWLVSTHIVVQSNLTAEQIAALALLIQIKTNNATPRKRSGRTVTARTILSEETREVRKALNEPGTIAELASLKAWIEEEKRQDRLAAVQAASAEWIDNIDHDTSPEAEDVWDNWQDRYWREMRGK